MLVTEKIREKDEAVLIVSTQKTSGKKVIHAHGCFDVLHYGHLRFLEAARDLGDFLVVSVTSAEFVNKGPGRPLFDNAQRCYQLACLASVDLVFINPEADACNLLKELKPDLAVRGSEYRDSDADITGKIDEETEAIESVGGDMVFLDTPVFSSTSLVNSDNLHLPQEIALYKAQLKNARTLEKTSELLDSASESSVMIVGDLIIDEYIFSNVLGTVSKHSAISASYKNNRVMGGGSLAIAKHIANFVKQVDYLARVGQKSTALNEVIFDQLQGNIDLKLLQEENYHSVTKTRYIASGYSNPLSGKMQNRTENTDNRLFEISHLPEPIDELTETRLMQLIKDNVSSSDILVVSDFGHGLITEKVIDQFSRMDIFMALNVQTNSSNFGFNLVTKYPRADFICIDEVEARLALGERNKDIDFVAKEILSRIECSSMMITRGKQGLTYYRDGQRVEAPALTQTVVDAVGAGDAVFAGAALCAFHQADMETTALVASVMGMLGTKIVGNSRSIEAHEVLANVKGFLKTAAS